MYLLEGMAQILKDYEELSADSVIDLAMILDQVAVYNVLGKAKLSEAFIESAIDALWKLAARARTLLQLGDAKNAQAATKTEDLLQRFSNVAIKAALVLKDNLEYMDRAEARKRAFEDNSGDRTPRAVFIGQRSSMLFLRGKQLRSDVFPSLYIEFPATIGWTTESGKSDQLNLVDAQMSFRREIVGLGNNTGLQIVSGTVGASLSDGEEHTIDNSLVSMGPDGGLVISIPVDTSALSDENTDLFFSNQKVQCVYWKDASTRTSPSDFGRWSNRKCKVASVDRDLDSAGNPIKTLGVVRCQCDRLANFAVGFGEAKVRFKALSSTPRAGDFFLVKSGDKMSFDIDTATVLNTEKVEVKVLSLTPAGRSFVPAKFTEVQKDDESGDSALQGGTAVEKLYRFEWSPRDAGGYRLEVELEFDGEIIDTQVFSIQVLFCQDILLPGETLQDLAFRNELPWQALFAINPNIQNARRVLMTASAGQGVRVWQCSQGSCSITTMSVGTTVKIGRLYTVARNETLVDVVTSLGSSFSQLARNNMQRLEAVCHDCRGAEVFDIDVRHNASNDAEMTYAGEEFCVVSSLADSCVV